MVMVKVLKNLVVANQASYGQGAFFPAGTEVDLPDDIAGKLIEGKQAILVYVPPPVVQPTQDDDTEEKEPKTPADKTPEVKTPLAKTVDPKTTTKPTGKK